MRFSFEGYTGFVALGNKITQMAKWGPGWEIYFEWFQGYYNGYRWLMMAWKNGEPELNGGTGFPGIWLFKNGISSYFRLGTIKNKAHTEYVLRNHWHTYKMTSYQKETSVSVTILIAFYPKETVYIYIRPS